MDVCALCTCYTTYNYTVNNRMIYYIIHNYYYTFNIMTRQLLLIGDFCEGREEQGGRERGRGNVRVERREGEREREKRKGVYRVYTTQRERERYSEYSVVYLYQCHHHTGLAIVVLFSGMRTRTGTRPVAFSSISGMRPGRKNCGGIHSQSKHT